MRNFRYRRSRGMAPEKKYVEFNFTDTTVPTTGYLPGSITNIAQGVGDDQRIGRKVVVKSISLRGEIKMPNESNTVLGAASPQSDVMRFMVVQDKQTNGAAANMNSIIAFGAANGGAATLDWRAFRNMDNIDRFNILVDRTVKIANPVFTNGTGSATQQIVQYNIYRKCNITVDYSTTTAAIGSQASNSLSIYCITSAGLASWNGIVRVRYTDA